MAKQNNTKNNASTDPKTDMVVQPETTPETENKNEMPEIHSDSEQSTVETVVSEQTESVTDTVLDSKSEAETTGKEGIEIGAEINSQLTVNSDQSIDDDEESGAALEAINKALKTSDVPSEPKEKTAQRERIATEVFAKNHRKSVLYFTSDMIPFFEKTDAIKHIKGLDDKTIVTVNKE